MQECKFCCGFNSAFDQFDVVYHVKRKLEILNDRYGFMADVERILSL